MKVIIALAALTAVALADHPAPAPYRPPPPPPAYKPARPAYKAPHYEPTPAHYTYGYEVLDDYHGVNFGHNEARDGYATNGQYHVLLPDGRVQTVTYTVADDYSGYVADVTYSGYAKPYAAPKPAYAPDKPAYAPGPAPLPHA